jgi:hypothetical protein
MAFSRPSGPGLAKARPRPLLLRRRIELAAAPDEVWRHLVDGADVVSEGLPRAEGEALVYYGTTSLLLPRRTLDDGHADLDILAAVLRLDPHVRLRALRIAQREAMTRAGGPLGPMHAELRVDATLRGVIVTIEVTAELAQGRRVQNADG